MKWVPVVIIFATLFSLGYLLTGYLVDSALLGVLGSLFYLLRSGGKKYVDSVPYAPLIAFALSSTSVALALISLVVKVLVIAEAFVYSFLATITFVSASMVVGYLRRVKG
ncbi:MAG: hypothetical protein ASUL_02914 [Candidatus Aramenus sulfurataquae]|jgi:uncharacterized membrane protein YjjP (DUF1212 family)|uniref:Uncharacterized protein n=2 Tax=Candidatus Aramenus sulfurataquae TaxID=1326980 RepID=W7KKR2_9CREN|nr:MAG: hypothetical protein ASUL_02914 [Candidatus Aramenus sulfurataquae]MCL7344772.1 hypothetical protein [Candidatus Aramenus sulfurataquae]